MRLSKNVRVPLPGELFVDEAENQRYDEHAGRFMLPVYRHLAARIAKIMLRGNRVLEIGTGGGRLAIELAKIHSRDWHIMAIDISADMLEIARLNAARSRLSDRIWLQLASAVTMPFKNDQFDLVISNASLHHWNDPVAVLNEIGRVTVTGGFCLIRDNMRLPPAAMPVINLVGLAMGMNKTQRCMWQRAIAASYTPGEVRLLLKETALQLARVAVNPAFLDLSIEWRKK